MLLTVEDTKLIAQEELDDAKKLMSEAPRVTKLHY
jgi:hypothetical protein